LDNTMKNITTSLITFAALGTLCASANAHVSFQQAQAEAGKPYEAVLHVSHGCGDSATTAIAVRVPAGFEAGKAQPKSGWTLTEQAGNITWTAATREAALGPHQPGDFVLAGKAPAKPQALWFKVVQTCEQGSLDWSQQPAEGTSTAGLKTPAVLLQVMAARDFAAAQAMPKVEGAWVRSAVAGQSGTGAFMKLTAREPLELVGASTPVAGIAQVHEMKMEGDVMRMRPVGKLDLPAGQPVELKPGGYHVMLQELKQPLVAGTTVPLTLVLRDAKGLQSKLELSLPVAATAPGTAAAAAMPMPMDGHKH
jgi:periplasmic copper chaperone A